MENKLFSLAAEVVENTSFNLFLTGKAGTGKTTFLKYIREHTRKNTVVVAPTGVAAINAGGVTMHSFFQLPFLPFLADGKFGSENIGFVDRPALFAGLRFSKEKLEVMRELELLIIDEVSMLRADMLDAMDEILRQVRGDRYTPFGGVQVLFIGDLYQLPPVVKDTEWMILKEAYPDPFFFSAKVLRKDPPMFIELQKVYRQTVERFISLLNNIRNNVMTAEDVSLLQGRFVASPVMKPGIVTLSTHNNMADVINQRELQKLNGPLQTFTGSIKGNFSDKNLPAEMELKLKAGAQVMFVKNDPSPEKKFFNGKLALIAAINDEEIVVRLSGNNEELKLTREKWKNVQYKHNKESGGLDEEEAGSYSQFPIRLAWAITIHKSQGLTFDHAVIDAGRSFAAGQVYVALSRCRSLQGIQLISHITAESVKSDERIIAFSKRQNSETEIEKNLQEEKPKFAAKMMVKVFDVNKLVKEIIDFREETRSKQLPDKVLAAKITATLSENAEQIRVETVQFMEELKNRFAAVPIDENWLKEKVPAAKNSISKKIHDLLILKLNELRTHLNGKAKVKQYAKLASELDQVLWKKLKDIERAAWGNLDLKVQETEKKMLAVIPIKSMKKPVKGDSKKESLDLYKKGLKAEEIAKQRALALTTIEGHLAEYVFNGEINVFDFVSEGLLEQVRKVSLVTGLEKLTPIKEQLTELSYGQIRMAVNYLKRKVPV